MTEGRERLENTGVSPSPIQPDVLARFKPRDRAPLTAVERARFDTERQVLALRAEVGNAQQKRRVSKGFGWHESAGRWEEVETKAT